MDSLADIVFERTPQATLAINSSAADVPRQLRTLLLAIDGRSPVAQYVPFLKALAPLHEKFAELERLGLLRRKETVRAAEMQPLAVPTPVRAPAPTLDSRRLETDPEAEMAVELGPKVGALGTGAVTEQQLQDFARELYGLAASAPAGADASEEGGARLQANASGAASPSRAAAKTPATLRSMLRTMENFLARQAGLDGLPLALAFEQITSIAQLRLELPAYFELIRSHGADARVHEQQLASMLGQAEG